ncbi:MULTISPECIES: MEDS domain-containing protein [Streptosporangium]|uniref:Anti-anti-sigma regulatory factor n=1 Tax=Streptosporangium brasiliense TaxID=47480 RepID=A0ABT9R241_9ACTN|nr:MEDS domain-containing protein [Streptosporangium brasiliense]MDP9863294.1 anti-anti-sigma regulatory factor [Streptosporangium brasiliense]
MRKSGAMPTLDPVDVGEHVCWVVDPAQGYTAATSTFLADGELFGDKVVIVGSSLDPAPSAGILRDAMVVDPRLVRGVDPVPDMSSMLGLVRREAARAGRQGYRALRVLAVMDELVPPDAGLDMLIDHELRLDEFVADSAAIMVCAYGRDRFGAATLDHVACVHPRELGSGWAGPSFRMFNSGPGRWSVCGVVDSDGAAAFSAALAAAAVLSPVLRLRFDELELMDAAGMRALVEAAARAPVSSITVEGANPTVRSCWEMLGYSTYEAPVELTP